MIDKLKLLSNSLSNLRVGMYVSALAGYYMIYYLLIDKTGAFTYTLIVLILSLYVIHPYLLRPLKKISNPTFLKIGGVFIFSFVIVYSKQNDILRAALDCLIIVFFFLSFLKATASFNT